MNGNTIPTIGTLKSITEMGVCNTTSKLMDYQHLCKNNEPFPMPNITQRTVSPLNFYRDVISLVSQKHSNVTIVRYL